MPLRARSSLLLALCLSPVSVFAFGSEVPDAGSVAFGRAGAFVARASDPSAIAHNVAAIVGLPGLQFNLSTNLASFDHCYQRSGTYDENASARVDTLGTIFEQSSYTNGATPYPRVCNRPYVNVTPQIMATWRPSRRFAFGFGLYSPVATGAHQEFLDTEQTPQGLVPSPARSMIFRKSLFMVFPMLVFAFQPAAWLRLGVGVAPSYASFGFGTVVNGAQAQAQSPTTDTLIDLSASGVFLAANLGVQVLPSRYLSFGAQAHYNSQVTASGRGDGTSNLYAPDPSQRVYSSFSIDSMRLQLPWSVRVGARFALPRAGRPHQNDGAEGRDYDPMTDDVFDLEAVLTYEATSVVGGTELVNTGNINVGGALVQAPQRITISSDLSNTVGARLGADINIIPGVLALRAGVTYETGAVSNRLAQIHLAAYAGVSVNAGLSWRWRFITTTVGYGHVFFQDNNADQGQRTVITPSPPLTTQVCAVSGAGPQACTVNRGVYQARLDQVSVGFALRF